MALWFHSLRGRITLVTVSVAVLAILATGLISLQVVRQSSVSAARSSLADQAVLLSRLPAGSTLAELRDRTRLALGDTQVGVVSPTGVAEGAAASYLTMRDIRLLHSGDRLSVTRQADGGDVLVEAMRTALGGAVVLATPIKQVEAATVHTQEQIVLALVLGILVALVAGTLLARWVSKPLVETARTARSMAAGKRGLRVSQRSPSEVADVGDALASLDTALATSESRQREFLLSISHELRTPITAVRGYAEAIADGMVRPDALPGVGRTLVAETERLDHFVSDLLELARLDSDDFSIAPGPVDVAQLLAQVRQAWLARSSQLGIDVAVELVGQLPHISSDARRLRQILDGLVENALRVAPTGSEVTLFGRIEGGRLLLQVRDTGPGLDAASQAVAFDRGALRDRYRDIRPVGTGLGLSIAARLSDRLGATIGVTSSLATGTVFTIALPVA